MIASRWLASFRHLFAALCAIFPGAALTISVFPMPAAASGQITWHVANNGEDSADCGKRRNPCRSLTQALANASDGDRILVGPGRYGPDLNGNESRSDPGEESAIFTCQAHIVCIEKRVTVVSVAGAEATFIHGEFRNSARNGVFIGSDGAVFGAPNRGFTVVNAIAGLPGTGLLPRAGISIEARNRAKVIGNIVRGYSRGIEALLGFNHLIKGNIAQQNEAGFHIGGLGVRVIENVAVANDLGMNVWNHSSSVKRNLVVDNDIGISVRGADHILQHNTITGNIHYGIHLRSDTGGGGIRRITVRRNNLYGNNGFPFEGHINCGIANDSNLTVDARNNFWGARSGPGDDPADEACDNLSGRLLVQPFALEGFDLP